MSLREQLLQWAEEIERCAEGAHVGINSTIQEMRSKADELAIREMRLRDVICSAEHAHSITADLVNAIRDVEL